ncbi:MAG: hypothetical protein LBC74_10905 [Planctomycetaceae bacterium]|jgi:hypothetical protein|nr:hypothetical protein [Planctomycetaceae bacterium]
MVARLSNFENYVVNLTDVTMRRLQRLFFVPSLFILLSFIIQVNVIENLIYAAKSGSAGTVGQDVKIADQIVQEKNIPQLTAPSNSPSKSKIYPKAIIRQLSQITASKQEVVEPLSNWAKKITQLIDNLILSWDSGDFAASEKHLDLIRVSIFELDSLRKSLSIFVSGKNSVKGAGLNGTNNGTEANLSSLDNILSEHYIPDVIAIEELQYGLERRYIFWKFALDVEVSETFPVSANLGKSNENLDKLIKLTLAVEKFLLNNKSKTSNGEKISELWINYFETRNLVAGLEAYKKSLQENTQKDARERRILEEYLVSFCSTVNVILYRFTDSRLTDKQVSYLKSPVIREWRLELERWGSDTVLPVVLLSDIERYEDRVGMSDMQNLFRTATRMAFSRSEVSRKFGLIVHEIYGGSNVKLYLSKVLVNHLIPSQEKEIKSFREYIQNQRVVGKRESDFEVKVNFIPDSERLLISLDVEGNIATSSRANAFATTLFNRGEAKCTAQKQVELTEDGFQFSPTEVKIASNRLQLRGIRTDFDGLPLISNLVRAIVFSQYELRRSDARKETSYKIKQQVKQRIDQEAESGFLGFNGKFGNLMEVSNNDFGLSVEKKGSITEEHWLLTSWVIRSSGILGGNTPAPATLRGSFADMKVHESAINAIISKLDIAGKTDTVGNFRAMISEQFKYKEIAEPGENDDVVIGFGKYNPVVVRFVDGVIELAISIDSLKLDRQTYRDFQVFIRYEPVYVENNGLVLRRRGVISLEKAKISSQIVLRAVFGKIFPEEKTFSLTPKFLKEDKRFEGLTTGLCRIGKGWFAIALVNSDVPVENPLVSDIAPINQFKR